MIGVCRADRQWSGQDHGRSGRRCDTQYLQRYRWVFSNRCWSGGYVLTLPSVRLLLRTGFRAAALPGVACPARSNSPGDCSIKSKAKLP